MPFRMRSSFFCPVILGDESGKGIAEVLYRHVGKGVDLHSGREGGHDHRAEAVDKPLYHEDAEVHHRLLETGEKGEAGDLMENGAVPAHMSPARHQIPEAEPCVGGKAGSCGVLGQDGGKRRACHAPGKDNDKYEVQHDVHDSRDGQEEERDAGIADGAEQARKIVVEKCGGDPCKDDEKVVPHQRSDGVRYAQEPDDPVNAEKDGEVDSGRHNTDKDKGLEDAVFIRSRSPRPKLMEKDAPLPMHRPRMMDVRNVMSV